MAGQIEKSTDQVQLKLVMVKRSRFSQLRLDNPENWAPVVQFFLYPRPLGRQQFFVARVLLWLAMIFFTGQLFLHGYDAFIAQYLHCLNLPVHESGHIIFGFFSKPVLTSQGGSIFQIIMPLVFCFALWIKPRDLLGASVGLWWACDYSIGYAGMALCCLWAAWSLFYYFKYQRAKK